MLFGIMMFPSIKSTFDPDHLQNFFHMVLSMANVNVVERPTTEETFALYRWQWSTLPLSL
jgi:hypothetical protein